MQPDQDSNWNYTPDGSASGSATVDSATLQELSDKPASEQVVAWVASEYLSHNRGTSWYLGLGGLAVISAVALYFVTKSIFSTALAPVLAIIVGVFATRKPQNINYDLNPDGLAIGSKFYNYREFKSFSVIDEGTVASITLSPAKRFMPPISVYFSAEDGDKITDMLGNYLPYETKQLDATERLARRLRF